MKFEVDIDGGGRRANIWLDEFPFEAFEPEDWIKQVKTVSDDRSVKWKSVCLEIRIHGGGRMRYAMVGASFFGSPSQTVIMDAGVNENEDDLYPSDCYKYSRDSRVVIGLPQKRYGFADVIVRGVSDGLEEPGAFPSGRFEILHAAYHEIDSDQRMFYRVSKVIPTLFMKGEEFYTSEKLTELIKSI